MMSNPEISLARSGIFSNESEKMMGNIFPTPNPMINIEINATVKSGETNTPATPISPTNAVSKRKILGFIQFKMMAPINRETVSPAKNALIPQAAFSMVMPYFEMRMFEIFVFVATSTPTIKKIDKAINATKRFFNKLKHDAKVAGFRSGFDSVIGVDKSQSAPSRDVNP